MKIGIVSPFNPSSIKDYLPYDSVASFNEGTTSVNTLVRSLLQEGHSVKVFTLCNDVVKTEKLVGENIEVIMIPTIISSRISGFKHHLLLDAFYVYKRLSKAIEEEIESLDVLHAHWTYDYAEACLSFVGRIPVFVTVRDWAPLQYKMQSGLIDKIVWRIKLGKFKKVMGNEKIFYIANSEYTLNLIHSDYPSSETCVIPNSVKKELIITEKVERKKHSFISISINLEEPRKNILTLLRAFKIYHDKYPEAELFLVGAINKEGDNYKRWHDEGLLEGVILHGKLSQTELIKQMDKVSCLIHPSLEETFGNILLEAMARCVPCIGGENAGAVPLVLGNGKYGIVCDITSPDAIFKAMESILDEERIAAMIGRATSELINNYSSDAVARRHISLYQVV